MRKCCSEPVNSLQRYSMYYKRHHLYKEGFVISTYVKRQEIFEYVNNYYYI